MELKQIKYNIIDKKNESTVLNDGKLQNTWEEEGKRNGNERREARTVQKKKNKKRITFIQILIRDHLLFFPETMHVGLVWYFTIIANCVSIKYIEVNTVKFHGNPNANTANAHDYLEMRRDSRSSNILFSCFSFLFRSSYKLKLYDELKLIRDKNKQKITLPNIINERIDFEGNQKLSEILRSIKNQRYDQFMADMIAKHRKAVAVIISLSSIVTIVIITLAVAAGAILQCSLCYDQFIPENIEERKRKIPLNSSVNSLQLSKCLLTDNIYKYREKDIKEKLRRKVVNTVKFHGNPNANTANAHDYLEMRRDSRKSETFRNIVRRSIKNQRYDQFMADMIAKHRKAVAVIISLSSIVTIVIITLAVAAGAILQCSLCYDQFIPENIEERKRKIPLNSSVNSLQLSKCLLTDNIYKLYKQQRIENEKYYREKDIKEKLRRKVGVHKRVNDRIRDKNY
uniref:Uncharacterized protein n=1 Tax=Onchocerca volvulus TaxID=6282 RepID=A0A8R1Y2S9_ONCVO